MKPATTRDVYEGRGQIPQGQHHEGDFHTYFGHKISKLRERNVVVEEELESRIFENCYFTINGLTVPPIAELRRRIRVNGGVCEQYPTPEVTHIVTNTLTEAQIQQLRSLKQGHIPKKYVTVDWVLDSIRLKCRQAECDYATPGLPKPKAANISTFFNKDKPSENQNASTVAEHENDTVMVVDGDIFGPEDSLSYLGSNEPVELDQMSQKEEPAVDDEVPANDELGESKSPIVGLSTLDPFAFANVDIDEEAGTPTSTPMHRASSSSMSNSSTGSNSGNVSGSYYGLSLQDYTTDKVPNFLKQFFARSRLHFIGVWRSRLAALAHKAKAKLTCDRSVDESNSGSSSGMMKLMNLKSLVPHRHPHHRRVILHIDLDCFFVSALIRHKPELYTKPVAVAHSATAGSSEISSCNYEARKYGLKNGMFMRSAKQMCPDLIVLPYDFELYTELSEIFYTICFTCGAIRCEPVSVDEAYLEFTPDTDGLAIAEAIRQRIYEETSGCTASVGVGGSMLVARLATKRAKPNGKFEYPPSIRTEGQRASKVVDGGDSLLVENEHSQHGEERNEGDDNHGCAIPCEHLQDLALRELPGVGWNLEFKLKEKHLHKCSDVWKYSLSTLQQWFGAGVGTLLFDGSRGIDSRALAPVQPPKSVGCDINWGIRFDDVDKAVGFFNEVIMEVSDRLKQCLRRGRTVTIKLKQREPEASRITPKFLGCGHCIEHTKSTTVHSFIHDSETLAAVSIPVFKRLLSQFEVEDLRGVGLHVSKLEAVVEASSTRQKGTIQSLFAESMNVAAGAASNSGVAKSQASAIAVEILDENDDDENDDDVVLMMKDSLLPLPPKPVRPAGNGAATTSSFGSLEFTMTQNAFLNELPQDIRRDAIHQLQLHHRQARMTSGHGSTNQNNSTTTKRKAQASSSSSSNPSRQTRSKRKLSKPQAGNVKQRRNDFRMKPAVFLIDDGDGDGDGGVGGGSGGADSDDDDDNDLDDHSRGSTASSSPSSMIGATANKTHGRIFKGSVDSSKVCKPNLVDNADEDEVQLIDEVYDFSNVSLERVMEVIRNSGMFVRRSIVHICQEVRQRLQASFKTKTDASLGMPSEDNISYLIALTLWLVDSNQLDNLQIFWRSLCRFVENIVAELEVQKQMLPEENSNRIEDDLVEPIQRVGGAISLFQYVQSNSQNAAKPINPRTRLDSSASNNCYFCEGNISCAQKSLGWRQVLVLVERAIKLSCGSRQLRLL